MTAALDLPRITIVTPSFNQGRFLEQAMRSVLEQGYPNLEYIVIDGGSTDGSVEIIKQYGAALAYWVSEPDRGQAHALNKGLARATGEIFGWLNSDDYYLPGALEALVRLRAAHPEAVAWIGATQEVEADGRPRTVVEPGVGCDAAELARWWHGCWFYQPGCLFSAAAYRKTDGFNEQLHIALDVDLWLRLRQQGPFATTPQVVAAARIYPEAKSQRSLEAAMIEIAAAAVQRGFRDAARWRLERFVEEQRRAAVRELDREAILGARSGAEILNWFTARQLGEHLASRDCAARAEVLRWVRAGELVKHLASRLARRIGG